ncbi:MAG: hypothetical protein M3R54_00425 [Chloroflexota bacterium]|nr:hypothetical protein [Chloroflexota bacterium]
MKRGLIASLAVLALGLGSSTQAAAASQIIVTPTNTQGWSTADTRLGGTVTFVADRTAPGHPHRGALQLTTNLTTTAKAQYLHAANTPLADVTQASYHTKQVSAVFPGGDPSYQVVVYLLGTSGFTTLVFEPYQNPLQGPVVNNVWQKWDVANGFFWSTRTVTCPGGTIAGTPGGPATYTLSAITALCPNAVVIGFGVNIGTFNPGYVVRTDLFNFNGTVYNFEPSRGHGNDDANDENDNNDDGQGSDSEE